MTQTEALKLALEALQKTRSEGYNLPGTAIEEAITAIKAALAQPAQQEPVAFLVDDDLYYPEEIDWETLQEQGHTVAALYTSPPAQRTEERNFCSRCGKRTADLTVIHTCTPPQPEQEPVAWATRMGEYAHIHWGAKRPEYPMVYEAPLYTTPPQRKPLTDEQKDILNFLFGLRAIDDVWFGDKHPTERGQYWWRNRLRKAFQEAAHGIKEKNT